MWIASGPAYGDVDVLKPGQWSGGAGVGFLANTPDGVAEFGIKGHADYFWTSSFSLGALAQYAGVGNDFVFGLSAQARVPVWDIREWQPGQAGYPGRDRVRSGGHRGR